MQLLFMGRHATVNGCDIHTRDLAAKVREGDIVVVAAGSPELVKGDWLKPGAVVVDVGINVGSSGSMVGDVEYSVAKTRASFITPVPGGVGPMTVAMLLVNTLIAYNAQDTLRRQATTLDAAVSGRLTVSRRPAPTRLYDVEHCDSAGSAIDAIDPQRSVQQVPVVAALATAGDASDCMDTGTAASLASAPRGAHAPVNITMARESISSSRATTPLVPPLVSVPRSVTSV